MRRILLLVVPVAALGVGGYYATRGTPADTTTAPAAPKLAPDQFVTRDGRVITLSTHPTAPVVAAPDGSSQPPPAITAPSPSTNPTAVSASPAPARGSAAAAAQAAVGQPTQRDRFDDLNHGKHELPVPVPGSAVLQKHLGAMANCQGPEYATLTGKARTDFAARCAKAGVTLPP